MSTTKGVRGKDVGGIFTGVIVTDQQKLVGEEGKKDIRMVREMVAPIYQWSQ